MQIDLAGNRALITGGNSGIGAACVRAFAAAGARVAINYRSRADVAEAMAHDLGADAGEAMAIEADVSDVAQVERMFRRIDDVWDGVDILVNNAGIEADRAYAWDFDVATWRRVIEVNLFGAFLCSREALRRMVRQKSGTIINMTSVHEVIAWSGHSAYAASKAGLAMLGQTLAQEGGPHGVRVVNLAPGAIRTPINADVWQDQDGLRDLLDKIPLKRIGETEDVAKMAVLLASNVASYVTGSTLFVDGGMTNYPAFMRGG